MAYIPASLIASGTRVPYHTTSRTRLSDVTADALRSTGSASQPTTCGRRIHGLSSEARQLLPPIMGGSRRDVSCDVSAASRAALLRAAESGTMRRALASTMHIDLVGFGS